ncbi:pollen-specific leucine-rich repeat extensin-like protein 4 [Arabidopsis lyrata subsp. lyrata]|uniref:pollen-specific leucine-rich repeat extensin-like protein 4 n=1 Tax=Arabidopsis lyrata subsp. lyrata TaxID=81972 RepID=UPI000A29D18D|nr:pollen-specific leucine-rich repeat extensin-like protein 4 [Arabidopsis lyrata subsp. lyrata]|eukprot:XP_020877127.1 pollen-specific leucine-rich repeat extensin-like protein 4 [Arabidopsis lyrata subsp. lyrata]
MPEKKSDSTLVDNRPQRDQTLNPTKSRPTALWPHREIEITVGRFRFPAAISLLRRTNPPQASQKVSPPTARIDDFQFRRTSLQTGGVKSLIGSLHGVASMEKDNKTKNGLDVGEESDREKGMKLHIHIPDGLPKSEQELEEEEKSKMPDSAFTRLLRTKGTIPAWFSHAPDHEAALGYNDFEGQVPPELFKKDLDAIFLNNNRFTSTIPDSLGESPASVVTFAHNKFSGCIPRSIGNMKNLNEIIFKDNSLGGCFPSEIGKLANVNVFDASLNSFTGVLPPSFVGLTSLEVFDISGNKLTGFMPENICKLPKLVNLTYAYNTSTRSGS